MSIYHFDQAADHAAFCNRIGVDATDPKISGLEDSPDADYILSLATINGWSVVHDYHLSNVDFLHGVEQIAVRALSGDDFVILQKG